MARIKSEAKASEVDTMALPGETKGLIGKVAQRIGTTHQDLLVALQHATPSGSTAPDPFYLARVAVYLDIPVQRLVTAIRDVITQDQLNPEQHLDRRPMVSKESSWR